MMRLGLAVACALALAACNPEIPDSAAGVGFGNYNSYASDRYELQRAARNAQLTASVPTGSPEDTGAPPAIAAPGEPLNAMAAPLAPAPISVSAPIATAPQTVSAADLAAAGIGGGAIIMPAAAPEAAIRREPQAVATAATPTPPRPVQEGVPARPADTGPDIVAYALNTTHSVGQPIYRRTLASKSRAARRCDGYSSNDMAQLAFLESGGPQRDRHGIDPDGDGYACGWDPGLYRRAVGR